MKNLKSIIALLVLTVFSVNVWGEDLNVNYDFTQASTYPSGFPTSSSTEREATQTISSSEGYEIVITSTDATKPYRGATSGSNPTYYLIFGKCKSTIPVTIDLPAINGFKLTSVSVGGTSAGSTNVYMSIRDAENEVINGGTHTQYKQGDSVSWTLSNTVANTSYKIYFLGNDGNTRNVQLASISLTYASAGPATYTLTYVGGEGATGDAPEEVTGKQKDAKCNLAGKNTLNKEGYKFVGWKSNVSGDTKIWATGEEYTMPAQNVTMTAQWSSVTYTDYITECTAPTTWVVKYAVNAPEGYSGNLPNNVELDPTESFTIPTNNYLTCAHYTQIGWNTDPEATIGQSSIEAQEAGTKVTLYAVWQAKKYEVKFNDNGIISTSQESYNTQITMPALSQGCAEYTSIGWTSVAPTNNAWASQPTIINTGAQCTVTDNVTYYAVYGENSSDPNTFTKISSAAELESGATYMYIWDKNDDGSLYAMSCSYSDEDYSLAPVSVIATNNSITDNELCNRWIFTKTGTQYSIKNAQSNKYLGCDDNNLAYLEAEQTVFDITIDNSGALDIHCPSCDYDDWWEAHLVGYISFYDEEKTFKFSSSYYDGNCYLYKGSTVSYISNPDCRTLTDIEVKTNPKVIYKEGEIFNPAGLIITATYETGDPKDIAYNDAPSSFGFAPSTDMPLTNETKVTISYGGKTCDLNITVTPLERYSVIFHNNGIEITPTTTFGPIVEGNAIGELPGVSGFDGLASCDENSPEFVGWTTAEMDEKSDTKPALVKSDFIPTNNVNLYAVWAKKKDATTAVQPNTVLAYWPRHKFDNAGDVFEAAIGTGTMTSNIALTDGAGSWVYGNQNISSTYPVITLSNLNLTSISNPISLSFVVKASQAQPLKIEISADGTNYTDFFTTGNLANEEVAYTIPNIPNTTKSIKITFQKNTGAFRIGTITLKTVNASNYVYTQLTETNTADWNGSDWDGYYLIYGSDTKKALNGYAPGAKSYYDVTPTDIATIEDNDIDAAFKIEYVQDNGYTVKAMGCGKYLQPANSALNLSEDPAYHSSINYNVLAGNNSYLRDNSNNFKYYAQSTQGKEITLYKILESYINYLTTCCTPLPAPEVVVDGEVETNKVTIKWNAVTGATGYQYSTDQVSWTDFTLTSKVLSGLNPNTEYTYYVRATCTTGDYCANGEVGSVTFTTKPLTVNITFNAATNGGTIDGEGTKVLQYTYNGEALTLPIPDERTGYKFNGWFTTKTGNTPVTNVGGDNKPTEDKTYFAQWTQLKLYKITYNVPACVNAEPYAEGTSQYEGISVDLKQLPEKVDDWTCIGWSTENPATATTIKPEILLTSLTDGLTGNMTVYAIYQKGEELPTGEFTLSVNYNNKEYYLCGLYSSGGYFYAKTEGDGTPTVFQIEEEDGKKYLYKQNGATKTYYSYVSGKEGDVGEGKGAWTIEQNTNGTWSFTPKVNGARKLCFSHSADPYRFKYYEPSETYLSNLTKHDIIKGQSLYTTVPCLPECELSVSGNVHLTTGKDIAVYTTTSAGNVITISAPHIDRADYIQCTFLNENNEVDANAPFALCENTDTYAKVTNGKISTTNLVGEFNKTYTISYTPTVANKIDNYTLQLKAYDDKKVELSTCTLAISGRSLPEQFAIVIKKDKQWYAVPNVLATSSSDPIPAAIEVNVNDNANPTYVIPDEKKSQILFQAASHPGNITWRRGAIRLQRANAESFGFITATHTDNTSFYMPNNNADDQQLYLTSTDCNKYKVTLDPALYENNTPTRWMSVNSGKIGWYNTQACDVYFLPINEYVVIRENLPSGKIGTMCQAKEIVAVKGGQLYQPNFVEGNYLEFIEVKYPVEAGMPLIYQADGTNDGKLAVMYGAGVAVEAALTGEQTRGMVGFISKEPNAQLRIDDYSAETPNYVFQSNKLYQANKNYLTNDRAYINLGVVQELGPVPVQEEPTATPRRRLSMGVPHSTATNLNELLEQDTKQCIKFIRDNKLFILREGKIYDATGKKIK